MKTLTLTAIALAIYAHARLARLERSLRAHRAADRLEALIARGRAA